MQTLISPLLPYIYVARVRLLASLAYRFDVFASLATSAILMLASVFLWRVAYRGTGTVSHVNQEQMVTYAIVSTFLQCLFQCGVGGTIINRLREGEIATDFIKPVNLLGYWLAEDIGANISAVARYLAPLLVLSVFLFQPPVPVSVEAFFVFIPSCLLSFAILWLISATMGMVAFWTLELGNLGMVVEALIGILSGAIVPLWFFPPALEKVSRFLPFQYTYQTPLAIYVGRTAPSHALLALAVQAFWVLALSALLALVWSKARHRVLVQGG